MPHNNTFVENSVFRLFLRSLIFLLVSFPKRLRFISLSSHLKLVINLKQQNKHKGEHKWDNQPGHAIQSLAFKQLDHHNKKMCQMNTQKATKMLALDKTKKTCNANAIYIPDSLEFRWFFPTVTEPGKAFFAFSSFLLAADSNQKYFNYVSIRTKPVSCIFIWIKILQKYTSIDMKKPTYLYLTYDPYPRLREDPPSMHPLQALSVHLLPVSD